MTVPGTRLCAIGGFLGAGKTTAILALARALIAGGQTVGVVTNDQGVELVDTEFLRSQGLRVLEVTGGCFCCNFDEFVRKLDELADMGRAAPDVILAEPVGSCTDLVATIFRPLSARKVTRFAVSPFTVVADPRRVLRAMIDGQSGFPSDIDYLFQKQLEEADIILLNKADLMTQEQMNRAERYLRESFPAASVLRVSAREQTGLAAWFPLALGGESAARPALDIDYDRYGNAEAYLGWLNASARVTSERGVSADEFLTALLDTLCGALPGQIAHVKAYAVTELGARKASRVPDADAPTLDGELPGALRDFRLVLNARACTQPEALEACVRDALEAMRERGAQMGELSLSSFAPCKPSPTHRMTGDTPPARCCCKGGKCCK